MNKSELLGSLGETRYAFDRVLAEVNPSQLTTSGVVGEWSVKDMIAHISWAVKETISMLEAKDLVGSELWQLPEKQRNAAVYEQNRDRSLQDVMSESQQTHRTLVDLVEEIPEGDLLHADWFAGLPGGEWPPWRVIQVNVNDHYVHHTEDLQHWMARSESGS